MTEKPELKIFERQKKSESIFDQKVIHSLKIDFLNSTIIMIEVSEKSCPNKPENIILPTQPTTNTWKIYNEVSWHG